MASVFDKTISVFDTITYKWVRRNFDEYELDEVLEEEYYAPIADAPDISDEVRQEVMEAIKDHNQDYLGYMLFDCDEDGEEEVEDWMGRWVYKYI